MTANDKNPRNRKLGAYPTPLEVWRGKSTAELAKAKSKMPGRIKAAGSITDPKRRGSALRKLMEESQLLDRVLREAVKS